MTRIVTLKITYGKNHEKDLQKIIDFEKSLGDKSYSIIPLIKEENGHPVFELRYYIND